MHALIQLTRLIDTPDDKKYLGLWPSLIKDTGLFLTNHMGAVSGYRWASQMNTPQAIA